MKKIYITAFITLSLLAKWEATAQRYFVTNLYAYELYLVNPAAAALKKDCYAINGYYQKQWFGTNEAPTTQMVSYEKGFQNSVGLGGYIYNDRNGATHDMGAQQSIAYRIMLHQSSRSVSNLLFGMSFMVNQRYLDMSLLDGASIDPSLTGSGNTSGYGYNANAGIIFTLNNWQIGFSATNLLPVKNTLYKNPNEPLATTDLNFHASYFFKIPDRDLYIEPLVFYRRNSYLDSRTDFNIKLTMPTPNSDLILWGLLGYRYNSATYQGTSHAVATTLGVIYNRFKFGLEYQFGLTNARKEFGNAYQLVVGYNLCRDRKKGAIPCPDTFKRNKKKAR